MVSAKILVLLAVDVVLLDDTHLLQCLIDCTLCHSIFLAVHFPLVAGHSDLLLGSLIEVELFAENVDSFIGYVVVM